MAIALSVKKVQAQNGLMMIYSLVALFLSNVLVLLLANSLFPSNVVLGTLSVPYWWAVHHSMFKLAVAGVFVMPLVAYYEWQKSITFTSKQWMTTYFFVNLVALWGISRFAENMGFGVSSFGVLIILALVFDFVQGMAMMGLGKYIKM